MAETPEQALARRGDPEQTPRHYAQWCFFKVDPAWRRLPAQEREAHIDELTEVLERWGEQIVVRTYSTVGVRPDCDLLIWRACPDLDELHRMQVEIDSTHLGTWLEKTYLYTSTTRPTEYTVAAEQAGFRRPRPLDVMPVDRKYIIVYPFVKQRRWYALSFDERVAAMREHAEIGRKYPTIKLNTAFSFGIDDQEFMTAFETDNTHDFLDLMMELRHTTASQYTERDTPIFTCLFMSPRETLEALGGVRASVLANA
jgi:chlorite dismutase